MSKEATQKLVDYLALNGLNDPDKVIDYLRDGADPLARDKHGKSALLYAAESDMYEDILEMSLYTVYKKENGLTTEIIFFDDGEYGDAVIDGDSYSDDDDVDYDLSDDTDADNLEDDDDYFERDVLQYDTNNYDIIREYGANNIPGYNNRENLKLKKVTQPDHVAHLNEAMYTAVTSTAVADKIIKMLATRGADPSATHHGITYAEASLATDFFDKRLILMAKHGIPLPDFSEKGKVFLLDVYDKFRRTDYNAHVEFISFLTRIAPYSINVAPLQLNRDAPNLDKDDHPLIDYAEARRTTSTLLSIKPQNDDWDTLAYSLYEGHLKKHPDWTFEEFHTRLQSMLFAHACGIPADLSEKDPAGWVKEYDDLNTIRNRDGTVRGHRDSQNAAKHTQDFLDSLTKQTLFPALIHRHPQLLEIWGTKLLEETKVELRHIMGQTLFGAYDPLNIPAATPTKIARATKKQLINNTHIRRDSKDPDIVVHGQWESLTPIVQGPNGYWLVPITTSEGIEDEATDRQHCINENLPRFLFDGTHAVAVRRDPDVPEYTAAVQPNKQGTQYEVFYEPLGYQNEKATQEALADWQWYCAQLNKGTWGEPINKIEFGENRSDLLKQDPNVDETAIRTGFDPRGPKGFEFAQKAWAAWGRHMGDVMRYRKMPLTDVLEQTGINQKLDELAYKYGKMGGHTPGLGPSTVHPPAPAP